MATTIMRKRHRLNNHMTRIVLLISFILLFGRFIYSTIGAWQHHQQTTEQQSSQTISPGNSLRE